MAWTYTAVPFTASTQGKRDTVRFLVGDTDTTDQQLQDSEVDGLISAEVDVYLAALAACGVLSARYSRRASKSVGNLSIQYSNISKQYAELRASIERQALRHNAPTPYAGGISQSDMEGDQGDDDLVQPNFTVGMDDNPGSAAGQGFTQVVPG